MLKMMVLLLEISGNGIVVAGKKGIAVAKHGAQAAIKHGW
jgi:hypothetical protein